MLYKWLLNGCGIALFSYLLIGIVTTCVIRMKNPLKSLEHSSETLFLTFDDGVDPAYTPILLDLLKKHHIKASFFVVVTSVKDNTGLLKRMKEEGHLIGLHSYKHHNQVLQLPQQIKKDFKMSIKSLEAIGVDVAFYRPPWGHMRPLGIYMCKLFNLKTVLWNVIVQDWRKDTTVELLCNKLKRKIHGNAVICLHDGRGKNRAPLKTIGALEVMIPIWKEEGYTFETVDKLF